MYKKSKLPNCVVCGVKLSRPDAKRCWSCYVKWSKIPGNNGNYKHGETSKRYYCKCGKEISYESICKGTIRCQKCYLKTIKGKNHPSFGKHHSKETKKKMSLAGGGTGIPHEYQDYPSKFYETREFIRKRDSYKCQNCNCSQLKNNKKLEVHHIDYNKVNCKKDNLITLCRSCHSRTKGNHDYWYAYFIYIMENYHG